MSTWPTLSNIDDKIYNSIVSKANPQYASQLNAWIRIFSGATSGKFQGLIIASANGFGLFKAAGQNAGSIYGDVNSPGDIGYDFNGVPIASGADRGLRPSPIITQFTVKEGKDQISKEANLTLKCFTLSQLETLQKYFMEPGYSLCVEWGWNEIASGKVLLNDKGGDAIVNDAADRNLNYNKLQELRVSSAGKYDTFLGFIVGGRIGTSDDAYTMEVKLRGAPGLPTFLQSQNKIEVLENGKVPDNNNGPKPYPTTELEQEGSDFTTVTSRRFKQMFNLLPAQRQTEEIVKLRSSFVSFKDFINMDPVVNKSVSSYSNPSWWESDDVTVGAAAIEKEKLFSKNRYISMALAVKILNENGKLDSYVIGKKKVNVKIDIGNSKIGAFPNMFSTKPAKLIIPGVLPDFSVYFLNTKDVEQKDNGILSVGGKDYPTVDNKIQNISFVETSDLASGNFKEKGNYWGYLKNLYVNFDVFNEKIQQKNKNIREVLLDILNELSSAVNSFWNFQVVERPVSKDEPVEGLNEGDIVISVIDENWVGVNPNNYVKQFYHSGANSAFLEANLELSLPSEMTNQIVAKRLALTSNPDEPLVGVGGFFESDTDLFLKKVVINGEERNPKKEQEAAAQQSANKEKTAEESEVDKAKSEQDALKRQIEAERAAGNDTKANQLAQEKLKKDAEVKEAEEKAANAALSQNLSKIDVVPKVILASLGDVDTAGIKDPATFKSQFQIFTFDDVAYFDKLRINAMKAKSGNGVQTLSHPLPIKYTFKILGCSGLRRGDTFNIVGIPQKYAKHGIFQITQVEHTISGMTWETEVRGEYRQTQ